MDITFHLTGTPMDKKVVFEVTKETIAELILANIRKEFPQFADWDGEVACDRRGAAVTFTKKTEPAA